MSIRSILSEIDSDPQLTSYEKYQKKVEVVDQIMESSGYTEESDKEVVRERLIGPDPIATQGGFFDRLGRSASRGVDQLQMNIGAIGEYAGELTGIDALREASGDLYEEQKRQMDAQAPAFQSIEHRKGPLASLTGLMTTQTWQWNLVSVLLQLLLLLLCCCFCTSYSYWRYSGWYSYWVSN